MAPFLAFEKCVRRESAPISHHLILCYRLKIRTLDHSDITLQKEEVDGALWLSTEDIKSILAGKEGSTTLRGLAVTDGQQSEVEF